MKHLVSFSALLLILSLISCNDSVNRNANTEPAADKKAVEGKTAQPQTPDSLRKAKSFALQATDYGDQIESGSGSVAPNGANEEILYTSPSYYSDGYVYTVVLTPESGDPDLHLYQNNPFDKLKESENYDLEEDMIQFTTDDFHDSPSRIDIDAIGRGSGYSDYSYAIYEKEESSGSGFTLEFPLSNGTPETMPVEAVVDFDQSWNSIRTRTGETGSYSDGCKAYTQSGVVPCSSSNTSVPWAYKKSSGNSSWDTNGFNYQDDIPNSNDEYMWYDNHTGYDYPVNIETPVKAMAAGIVVSGLQGGTYNQIVLQHSVNGTDFRTYYLHLNSHTVSSGTVSKGQKIGESGQYGSPGAPHLHITVKQLINGSWVLLDPYGEPGLYGSLWE